MKRKICIVAAAILTLGCIGTLQAFTHLETQEPQEIRGIIVDEHDAAWYEQQQALWHQKVQANPTDEHAWEQCFSAARYADMLQEQYGMTDRKKAVLDEMSKHIPNSFTYNLVAVKWHSNRKISVKSGLSSLFVAVTKYDVANIFCISVDYQHLT